MASLPLSPPTSSPVDSSARPAAISGHRGRRPLRRFSSPIRALTPLTTPSSTTRARVGREEDQEEPSIPDEGAWRECRTRRDSLEVEKERRQRRRTLASSSSPSSSPLLLPSLAASSSCRGQYTTSTVWLVHQPAPIRPVSASFLEHGLRASLPPYRPRSPDQEYGVVEGWEEVSPVPVSTRNVIEEDVPTAEHIEYYDPSASRLESSEWQTEEDVPRVGLMEDHVLTREHTPVPDDDISPFYLNSPAHLRRRDVRASNAVESTAEETSQSGEEGSQEDVGLGSSVPEYWMSQVQRPSRGRRGGSCDAHGRTERIESSWYGADVAENNSTEDGRGGIFHLEE